MLSICARSRATKLCGLFMLVMLAMSGCQKKGGAGPTFHVYPGMKKTREVPCDTTINADTNTGGVDLGAAYVCENDTVTWQVAKGHHFTVVFKNGSPFVNGKSNFSDQDPSGAVKDTYTKLEVYKYSITVDNLSPIDPQVVGGGNP